MSLRLRLLIAAISLNDLGAPISLHAMYRHATSIEEIDLPLVNFLSNAFL